MTVSVQVVDGGHCLVGDWPGTRVGNEFLAHLRARAFSPATVRAYAFDLVNFARFLDERNLVLGSVEPMDVFAWVDWQGPAHRRWAGWSGWRHAARPTSASKPVRPRRA